MKYFYKKAFPNHSREGFLYIQLKQKRNLNYRLLILHINLLSPSESDIKNSSLSIHLSQ